MKTFLRLSLCLTIFAFGYTTSNAQCTVSDVVVQKIQIVASATTSCTVKFDVSFNIEDNNGNKFIYLHAWLQTNYPNYFKCENGRTTLNGSIAAPTASDLGNTGFNIGINNADAVPSLLTTYEPDATVPITIADSVNKVVLPDGTANFTIYGVTVTSPFACDIPNVLVVDLWSSQTARSQRAQCVSCGIRYSAGYLNLAGNIDCNLNIKAVLINNTATPITGYYKLYVDVDRNGYFEFEVDTLLQASTSFTLSANGTTTVTGQLPVENRFQNVFVLVTQTSGSGIDAARVFMLMAPQCAVLPVSFTTFSATRNSHTNVLLKWETATEINNSGFLVERNETGADWKTVTFVPTQAQGGTAGFPLAYQYTDLNTNKGVTQYRIKQVDLDGRTSFSSIQVVRGDIGKGKLMVYPNPSTDGHVSILFEDQQSTRDVTLSNMSGLAVKQWTGIKNNILRIDNLGTGMYILKVTNRETGYQLIERIVVVK